MSTAPKPVEIVPTAYPNPLVNDYLYDFSKVSRFFGYDPRQAESLQRRAAFLQGRYRPEHLKAVARVLETYNREMGAGEATLESIERLRQGAVVVIGGQQAGVLTGPLYAIHKAVTAVQLARYLSEELDIDAVPAFWVASDDHDFAEIDHIDVLTTAGGKAATSRLHLAPPEGAGDFPAGVLPCVPEAVEQLLDALCAATPPSEYKDAVLRRAGELAAASTTLAEWFGRLMTYLFEGTGLILVDPMAPGFKALAAHMDPDGGRRVRKTSADDSDEERRAVARHSATAAAGAPTTPAMAHFIPRSTAIAQAFDQRSKELTEAGYPLQVEKDITHTHLFMYLSWRRRPVYWNAGAGRFAVRHGPLSLSPEEFFSVVCGEPEAVSPDVVLRPVLQDMVLPVIALLGGPGEISYLAQLGKVYRLFDMELPVVFPRLNLTLLEPGEARLLEKYGLGPTTIAAGGGLEAARAAYLEQADKVGLSDLFGGARRRVEEIYADLRTGLEGVDKGLAVLAGENEKRVLDQVGWLEGRAEQAHRKANDLAMGHFERLEKAYRPDGNWQERVYNIFPFLFKYGPELCHWLCEQPLLGDAPFDFGHRFISL